MEHQYEYNIIFKARDMYCKLSYSINDEQHLCKGETIKKEWTEYISPGWRTKE